MAGGAVNLSLSVLLIGQGLTLSGSTLSATPGVSVRAYRSTSSSTSLTDSDYYVGYTGSTTATFSLPLATTFGGTDLLVKNKGSGTVTLDATSTGGIYTSSLVSTLALSPGEEAYLIADGSNWVVGDNPDAIGGTAGQVLVNGGTTPVVGPITLSLASALTSINSVTSAALSALTLGTGTFGTAATFASATGALTLAQGALSFTGATTITGGAGNMTILAGTGASRTLTLQTTTALGAAQNNLVLNADGSASVAGMLKAISGIAALATDFCAYLSNTRTDARGAFVSSGGNATNREVFVAEYNNTTGVYGAGSSVFRLWDNGSASFGASGTVPTASSVAVQYTTASTSSTTGALVVSGGAGFAKDVYVNGVRVGMGAGSISTNTAVGSDALAANITGANNTTVGQGAMALGANGNSNSAFGFNALSNNTGGENSAFGRSALYTNTSGAGNTAIGFGTLFSNSTGSGNVALGKYAGLYETGSNSFYVDNQDRVTTAGDKAGALLYGTFNATPASQTLTINAGTTTVGAGNTPVLSINGAITSTLKFGYAPDTVNYTNSIISANWGGAGQGFQFIVHNGSDVTAAQITATQTTFSGTLTVNGASISLPAGDFAFGANATVYTTSGVLHVRAGSTLGLGANGSNDLVTLSSSQMAVTYTGASTSASTGALVVSGGVGVAGNLSTGAGRISQTAVITSNTTLDSTYHYVICNSTTPFTVTLPAAPNTGQTYVVKSINSGTITVAGNGKTIFALAGASSIPLGQGESAILAYDGTRWSAI